MKVKAVIAYDGSSYQGFQKQKRTPQTVSHAIESALRSLQITDSIVASGRTDAGVHATGQVIHFDLPSYWQDPEKLKRALNRQLTDISFKHISRVASGFHARFSAQKRLYRYVFKTTTPSVFEHSYVSFYPTFDTARLAAALHCFEGEHDFSCFHKSGTDTHTNIREIYKSIYQKRGNYHYIYFQANGFLRAQVRMMVEASMMHAQGTLPLSALKEQIGAKIQHTTRLAPPQGLYLARITY